MGNGKICDCCMDFTSLLQSYDRKRAPLSQISDVAMSREEVETIILYLQSWTQRQCSCCFRDVKNFERFNWALQVLILVAVEILKNTPHPLSSSGNHAESSSNLSTSCSNTSTTSVSTPSSSGSNAGTPAKNPGGGAEFSSSDERMEVDVTEAKSPVSQKKKEEKSEDPPSTPVSSKEKPAIKDKEGETEKKPQPEVIKTPSASTPRPLWDVEDKDKLLHFVSKLFLNSFPTYVAYKQHTLQLKSQAHHPEAQEMLMSPQEIQLLSIFCDINEPEASPYLFRNVSLFCHTGGIDHLSLAVHNQTPDSMSIQRVNILVGLATNLKTWLSFQSLLKYYVPFRSYVMAYLCKIVETQDQQQKGNAVAIRNMTEFIWSAVKEPVDAHLSFDKDGLDLAFKYFLSTTLTMRLAGVNQINSYINLFNELVNSEHIIDSELLDSQLCKWLLDNQLIQHIFGPNLHVEVIKQSHTILTFLAMEGRVTNEHVDIMWQAAQLKHCSKQVYDILSSLICNLEPGPVLHLHNLLKKLEPKDHTEQSLYLASALLKFIWTNTTVALGPLPGMAGLAGGVAFGPGMGGKNQRRLRGYAGGNGGGGSGGKFSAEISSSENSVSVDASHSDDEIQPGSPRDSKSGAGDGKRMYKNSSSYLCKVMPTSSDESLSSNGDSDEDPDSIPVSGAFPPAAPANLTETHSDSDADGERSGNEDCVPLQARKGRRKVLRRKKCAPGPKKRGGSNGEGITPKKLFAGDTSPGAPGQDGGKDDNTENIPLGHQDPLEPNVVISQLGNLVQMTDASAMFQDYVSPPDNMDGSDGSYSSRMSTKSEKNMADFDGEDSNCDEDSLMQSLAQNQLVEMVAAGGGVVPPGARGPHHQLRLGPGALQGPAAMFGPRGLRRFNQRKRAFGRTGAGGQNFNFQIDNVCQPGQTLLWDLVQDDKIVQLSDGLAIEAQKALTNLLCFSTDKLIRFKFIEGCLDNLVKNKSVVVSLRLLPKLLTSFQPLRLTHHHNSHSAAAAAAEIHQVTLWADREHKMLEKFFTNLQTFAKSHEPGTSVVVAANQKAPSPFPYHVHVQVRLEFLSVLFSIMSSPDDFRLSLEQVDQLWECLAVDVRCSDDLFIWLTGQVRIREQHALSPEAFRYILIRKIPSLPPTTITMHALTLFQQLCSMTRIPGILQDQETSTASMDYLWRIALCANSTDVSMTAIQYLNGYYISRQLEKEEEFVRRCMSHLVEATEELLTLQSECTDDEALLLKIQRALVLLKTHLETFRRRYAYHLRKWLLEGRGVGSHAQLVGEKGAVPVRVVIQPAGYHEKVTLELLSSDYVADLRAEVAKWWETVQQQLAMERCGSGANSTPVLGSLLTEGPIRMITQGIELSAEYDEKCLSEVPVKDLQLVYVSMGASRPQKKRGASGDHHPSGHHNQQGFEYSSSLPPPPRDKLPVTLLLQPQYFEQLFSLMQTLSSIKVSDRSGGYVPNTKAQVLSRRVWDILMLLPTNPSINEGFTNIAGADSSTLRSLLDPHSPQKLMYSLYIVEALVKLQPPKSPKDSGGSDGPPVTSWRQQFVECGGLQHLFSIFSSGQLETIENGDWSEWKQDCLASLLKILCFLGVVSDDSECLSDQLYDVNEGTPNKKRMSNSAPGSGSSQGSSSSQNNKRRKVSTEKTPIPRLNDTMLKMMEESGVVMTRLTNILQACSLPRDPNHYKTGFWGRAQVVHYAMAVLVCWAFSCERVRSALYQQKDFPVWLRRLVLEDPEPSVRKEACIGLYRLCLGTSTDGKTGAAYSPQLISHLLNCLPASLSIKPCFKLEVPVLHSYLDEAKDAYGPACRDYFWLLGRLIDSLTESGGLARDKKETGNGASTSSNASTQKKEQEAPVDLNQLAITLSEAILGRDYMEARHNTICDDGLVGLLSVMTVVMKHNPPFKTSKMGQQFLKEIFDGLFSLPSPQQRYLPKFKATITRSAAYDLLTEMARNAPENYYLLQNLLMDQHQPNSHAPYPWDYWPHEDGRSPCGYVGLTNLGATCYMASCMQHLYMMPQARAAILGAAKGSGADIQKHGETLRELQKMFAYLMESERKAYNPRSFCKVYQMDHQPLNTGEQKDMAEFFIDLVSKLEEMTPELKKLVKNLFCGVLSNNVVSLDCTHVSRTLEEFYTVRCQVADMRNLYESLDEVTVKDTLEGDNMYTCSQCGKKVRAEKRACFKKLPRILCFNTMRYTFNMITMLKEKVNTHFSFPMQLDMGGYVEKTLMPQQYQEEKEKKKEEEGVEDKNKEGDQEVPEEKKNKEEEKEKDQEGQEVKGDTESFEAEEDNYLYELIGVTVHTGTADGGHYYSFIRDRSPMNRDKWYLFNDAEVKPFDPSQLAAECFGGEMSTKTYDSVTDKFMDFSFEKTNSAYMLFYEQCPPPVDGEGQIMTITPGGRDMLPCLPGGSSQHMQQQQQQRYIPSQYHHGMAMMMAMGQGQQAAQWLPQIPNAAQINAAIHAAAAAQIQAAQFAQQQQSMPVIELNKELEDWIWHDNTQFLRDKNIFEHTYFNFMSHVCGQIPHSLVPSQEDVMLLAAKLSVTFFLETYIHAKEKPMMQWVEMITKPLVASQPAAAWLLDHMAETNYWPVKIFLKCPNQIVRQMFHGLCFHVIQQLRPRHVHLYLKLGEGSEEHLQQGQQDRHPDTIDLQTFGSFSCVTRYIKSLLNLLENGAKGHLKHLTEYFALLLDFSKMGDEECLFLINSGAISKMVGFYLGKKEDSQENNQHQNTDEEEDEDEIVSIPTEKNRVVSLEKMIALVATLVEKSRDDSNSLRLSASDMMALTGGGKTFSFILQQIRDGINYTSTRNLIFSLCRWDEKLAESIVASIFQTIQKHPDICQPYFKVLNLLAELVSGPVGMPKFTELILNRILDVADICAYPTLEWLSAQVPRNKIVHQWCLQSMDTWVEHFLIAHQNQKVRNAAASLLVSLVPHPQFRQGYRSTKFYMGYHPRGDVMVLPQDAQIILHEIYMRLLNLLKPAKHYTDIAQHGTSKLTAYFAVLTYFTVSKVEKLMFGSVFMDLWNLFHPKLSEPSIPCHHNKQALLTFWHHVCLDCPENIQKIICSPAVVKQIGFNYILADHEDQEVVMFNRNMLPAYYSILRMCCQASRPFCMHLARHQNITWAFKNISPFPTQYNAAVDELFKMMQLFVQKTPETSEQELMEIQHFKRGTLQLFLQILDGRSNWATMISAFRILIEGVEDRIFVVANNGLCLIFEALHVLHTMHHEATACHVVAEIVELLTILTEILRTFRPKELPVGVPLCNIPDIQIHRFILNSKEWPNILSKLATLLNTYNHGDLRNAAIDCLIEFLYVMPLDTLRTLVPLMVHCHSACQDAQTSGMGPPLGPYFPKRSASHHHHSHVSVKSSVRPPRPMLQMAFPHLGQETAKGLDEEYDRQLHDFYTQYHQFIDLMCRVAFMREYVTQELVTLSAMVGYEAAPLHFVHFPKLWLEVHNTLSLDRKYISMLVNTNYFTDYVELIMLEERACLTNIMIFNFLATFLPKVFEQVGTTDQMCKVLLSIVMDMESLMAKQVLDIETHAIGILGDLKALTLFYVPTCQQKGPCKNPLPSPAPAVPYLQKTLRKFQGYLETVMQKRIRDSVAKQQQQQQGTSRQGMLSPEGVPMAKKRKLEGGQSTKGGQAAEVKDAGGSTPGGSSSCSSSAGSKEEPKPSSSGASSGGGGGGSSSSATSSPSPSPVVNEPVMFPDAETQRNYIALDLGNLLEQTIENLLRGISTANPIIMESEDDTGEEVDVGGGEGAQQKKKELETDRKKEEKKGTTSASTSSAAEKVTATKDSEPKKKQEESKPEVVGGVGVVAKEDNEKEKRVKAEEAPEKVEKAPGAQNGQAPENKKDITN